MSMCIKMIMTWLILVLLLTNLVPAASQPEFFEARAGRVELTREVAEDNPAWDLWQLYNDGLPAAKATNDIECLLAFCETSPNATMCASSPECVDTPRMDGYVSDTVFGGVRWNPCRTPAMESCDDSCDVSYEWYDASCSEAQPCSHDAPTDSSMCIVDKPYPTGGKCWGPGSDPCADGWKGVSCCNAVRSFDNYVDIRGMLHLYCEYGDPQGGSSPYRQEGDNARRPMDTLTFETGTPGHWNDSQTVTFLALPSTGEGIKSIPAEISSCANLLYLSLEGNKISDIPPEVATLDRLEVLHLDNNQLTGGLPYVHECDRLRELTFEGNPWEAGARYKIPYWTKYFGEAMTCPSGWMDRRADDVCEFMMCSSKPFTWPAVLIGFPLSLFLLYRFASTTWRPSNRAGAKCIVHSDGNIPEASRIWQTRVAAHLEVADAQVHLTHPGSDVQLGDDVWIGQQVIPIVCPPGATAGQAVQFTTPDGQQMQLAVPFGVIPGQMFTVKYGPKPDLGNTLSHLNGHLGTVIQIVDTDTAKVCVHGISGTWELSVNNLTVQPLLVDRSAPSPAVCFCIGKEWIASPAFTADIVHVLARRGGVEERSASATDWDDILTTIDHELASSLSDGVAFILCGGMELEDEEVFMNLKSLLQMQPDQIIRADRLGEELDDNAHVSGVLNLLEHFLDEHRHSDEHKNTQGILSDAIENRAATTSLLADRNAQHIAKHTQSLIMILSMQLQQSFTFLSWPWRWPDLLVDLRELVGSWVLLDVPTIIGLRCLLGEGGAAGQAAPMLQGMMLPFLFGCVLGGILGLARDRRAAWKRDDNEAAGAAAAHLQNFGWALYTLVSPAVVLSLFQYYASFWELLSGAPGALHDAEGEALGLQQLAFLSSPFVLIIPAMALYAMRQARKAGVVHSRAFEAQYGWLCSKYRAEAYAWEMLNLEVRYVTAAVGCFMKNHPIYSAQLCIAITLCVLVLQIIYKPYLETAEEASHWSSSNKMGALGYVCQLVVLVVGLISVVSDPLGDVLNFLLAAVSFVALALPLVLTVTIIAPCHKSKVDNSADPPIDDKTALKVTNPLRSGSVDDMQPGSIQKAEIPAPAPAQAPDPDPDPDPDSDPDPDPDPDPDAIAATESDSVMGVPAMGPVASDVAAETNVAPQIL